MSKTHAEELLPELIRKLPEADIPFPGVKAWLSQGSDHQIGFFDILLCTLLFHVSDTVHYPPVKVKRHLLVFVWIFYY